MKRISRRLFLERLGLGIGSTTLLTSFSFIPNSSHAKGKSFAGKKLNVALCGLVNYAELLAERLKTSQYCQLTGVVTGHPAKAQERKQKYTLADKNINNYKNFDTIATNQDIDLDGFFELSTALSFGPFKGKSSKGTIDFPVINQQAVQLDAIGKLISEKKPLPQHITGEEGLKDVRIIEAIYKAAETSRKTSLT